VNRWGKAGVRLTEEEAAHRGRTAVAERNRKAIARTADDRIAYRLWRAGQLQPNLITHALDARGLHGPQVDVECGAAEPDVDLWEAGKLYPTWRQLLLLAELTGNTPRFLCSSRDVLTVQQTSLRFHGWTADPAPVRAFDPAAVAATVADAPHEMPEES
jgi:hypothetical protein